MTADPAGRRAAIARWAATAALLLVLGALYSNRFKAQHWLALLDLACLLVPLPVWRAPGFWWLLAGSAWQALSSLLGDRHLMGSTYLPLMTYPCAWAACRAWPLARSAVQIGSIVGAGVLALWAVVQFVVGSNTDGAFEPWYLDRSRPAFDRGTGFFGHHLTPSFLLALAALLVVLPHPRLPRALRLGAAALCGVGMLVVKARTMVLASMVATVAWVLAAGRWRWLWVPALVIIAGFGFLRAFDHDRLQLMTRSEDPRWGIWRCAGELVRADPLFGARGDKNYENAYRQVYERRYPQGDGGVVCGTMHAHNSVVGLAATSGLPAVALHLGFVGALAVFFLRRRRREGPAGTAAALGLSGLALYLAAGAFEHYAGQNSPQIAFGLFLALAAVLADEGRQEVAPSSQPPASAQE